MLEFDEFEELDVGKLAEVEVALVEEEEEEVEFTLASMEAEVFGVACLDGVDCSSLNKSKAVTKLIVCSTFVVNVVLFDELPLAGEVGMDLNPLVLVVVEVVVVVGVVALGTGIEVEV